MSSGANVFTSKLVPAFVGYLIVAPHAFAQNTLEEVVVTALKRAESLQEAPATVTVFDADRIEEAGITSMRDYV
jgi:outer membrane receptor protein involved in Fe transport